MFEQTKNHENKDYRGIVGIVNVPYSISRPTHNKQAFQNANEKRNLINVMNDCMEQYLNNVTSSSDISLDMKFWSRWGYSTIEKERPSMEIKYYRQRLMSVKPLMQCSICLKWRVLKFHPSLLLESYYDNWTCQRNTDPESGQYTYFRNIFLEKKSSKLNTYL
jgi:hypothetical protein